MFLNKGGGTDVMEANASWSGWRSRRNGRGEEQSRGEQMQNRWPGEKGFSRGPKYALPQDKEWASERPVLGRSWLTYQHPGVKIKHMAAFGIERKKNSVSLSKLPPQKNVCETTIFCEQRKREVATVSAGLFLKDCYLPLCCFFKKYVTLIIYI